MAARKRRVCSETSSGATSACGVERFKGARRSEVEQSVPECVCDPLDAVACAELAEHLAQNFFEQAAYRSMHRSAQGMRKGAASAAPLGGDLVAEHGFEPRTSGL